MRDAVTFEALGIPTIVLMNDVFEPIADATAALLRLPEDYVATNIVRLPHPTSNLTATAAATLIDERIELVRNALLGRAPRQPAAANRSLRDTSVANEGSVANEALVEDAALETARSAVRGLAQSLNADGADLILTHFRGGVLHGELRARDATCDDGSCIMPTDSLERMLEAMLRDKIAALRGVTLRAIDLRALEPEKSI